LTSDIDLLTSDIDLLTSDIGRQNKAVNKHRGKKKAAAPNVKQRPKTRLNITSCAQS